VDKQKDEQRPLLAAPECDLSSIISYFERTEESEIHRRDN
jgi:hypothetical protein